MSKMCEGAIHNVDHTVLLAQLMMNELVHCRNEKAIVSLPNVVVCFDFSIESIRLHNNL